MKTFNKIPIMIVENFVRELSKGHVEPLRNFETKQEQDEFVIDENWRIVIPQNASKIINTATRDFQRFLNICMGVDVPVGRVENVDRFLNCEKYIIIREDWEYLESRSIVKEESYIIRSSPSGISIRGYDAKGCMYGLYYLEKLMGFREAPFLRSFEIMRSPIFNPRVSVSVFEKIWPDPGDPKMYRDGYLSLMSHFSINGTHIYTNFFDYSMSDIFPQLKNTDAEKNFQKLNKLVQRAKKHGIDVYLTLNTPVLPPTHEVFKKHPEIAGATHRPQDSTNRSMCTSHPNVLEYLKDGCQNLFHKVPDLKGLILIIGSEGFLHCYTGPVPRPQEGTSCPRCAKRSAEEVVAELVNTVADGVKEVNDRAEVMVWPYSAFVWSKDPYQLDFIKRLSRNVTFLSEFEKDEVIPKKGFQKHIWDYSIDFIGPSKRFVEQAKLAKSCGLRLCAKTESAVSLEFYNVPCVPVMYRWYQRFKKIGETSVDGLLEAWRFYGFTGSIPEEIEDWYSWTPLPEIDDLLGKIAKRDLGEHSISLCSEAWKRFSKAMEYHPRIQPYFFGPLFMGPAHPLILDVEKSSTLPEIMFTDMIRLSEADGVTRRHGWKPLFATDLSWTGGPHLTECFIEHLEFFLREWEEGVSLLSEAVGKAEPRKRPRSLKDLGVAKMISHIIRTSINVARFYRMRDELKEEITSKAKKRQILEGMLKIAREEKANSTSALKLVERDYRLGFGYTYEVAFTPEMIRAKIRQVEDLIQEMDRTRKQIS
jgi:hypothetical protein